jgi:hypothetical protein
MTERPNITITLRPEPRVDALAAVRALLKLAIRRFGLRCTGIEITNATPAGDDAGASEE